MNYLLCQELCLKKTIQRKTIQDISEKHETNYSTVTDVNDISDQTELTDLYNNSN